MTRKEAIVEYFFGSKNIYGFLVTKDDIKYIKIENSKELNASIDTVSTLISRIPDTKRANGEYHSFVNNSKYLYKEILEPLLSDDLGITKLSLVLDKALNAFPFDILIKDAGEKPSYDLDNIQYLFEDYTLSNQYSINHWDKIETLEDHKFDQEIVGFAPSFGGNSSSTLRSCDDNQLIDLKCNAEELKAVSDYLDGSYFENSAAAMDKFVNNLNNSKVLHLATHTCIDTNNTGLSRIYLSDNEVTMLDLNTYDIKSKLAVLSACNTGIGEYISGDGVQSLAWAFMQAGCQSTLMSLWPIDDCTTSDFMSYYYKNLKAGKRKDESLQLAQIEFLSKAPKNQQHPFYWAAFTTYGSMDLIRSENSTLWLIVGALLLALMLFGFYKIWQVKRMPENAKNKE